MLGDAKTNDPMLQFALVQLARRTGDRYRDVNDEVRSRVLAWLGEAGAAPHNLQLVREGGQLDTEEAGRVFGEALPKGLRLR